jgi:hypothetical protein
MSREKNENKHDAVLCPVGRFFSDLEKTCGKESTFFEHMKKSRIEFLKGIRSLVDVRIEEIEKREKTGHKKKATRVTVE